MDILDILSPWPPFTHVAPRRAEPGLRRPSAEDPLRLRRPSQAADDALRRAARDVLGRLRRPGVPYERTDL